MSTSAEVLREELRAAESALADCQSQRAFAQLSAEKSTLKAQNYQGELHCEQQYNNALAGGEWTLAEVIEELQMSELLCAEARDSAQDAVRIRGQAVSAAKVLVQAHSLLTQARVDKARAWEDVEEESEAYKWKKDALKFEEHRAQELREAFRGQAEFTEAALHEYRSLRAQRDNCLHPRDGQANSSLLDEAEILQNQVEMTLGVDLWRRMRKAEELDVQSLKEIKKAVSPRCSLVDGASEALRRVSAASARSVGVASSEENQKSSRRSSTKSQRSAGSEAAVKRASDGRKTPAELRSLAGQVEEHKNSVVGRASAAIQAVSASTPSCEDERRRSSEIPAEVNDLKNSAPGRASAASSKVDMDAEAARLSHAETQRASSIANTANLVSKDGEACNAEGEATVKTEAVAAPSRLDPAPAGELAAQVTENDELITSPASQKSSVSYSSRGIPSASQARAAERSPRSPRSVSSSVPSTRSPRTKKIPFKPSSPSPRLITKHPPGGFNLRPALGAGPWSDHRTETWELPAELNIAKTSSVTPSQTS